MNRKTEKLSLEECLASATETRELLVQENALEEIPGLIKKHFDAEGVCVIADENTWAAAGWRVTAILKSAGILVAAPYIYPALPRLHAEYSRIEALASHIKAVSGNGKILPLSAGSGTVNDLVKRAASEACQPYLSVPTAASVDGYTSYGAALLSEGFKQTFPCSAPRALAADTAVLRKAPAFLSSSGFGDLAGKLIAGTDWVVADHAGKLGAPACEPIESRAWAMTQGGLWETLEQAVNAWRGDGEAVKVLFAALSVTGFAMQYSRSSRPVSGCEHLFSHIWEMEDLSKDGAPVTHGHKVALGTLAAAAFTETLFKDPSPPLPAALARPSRTEREAEVRAAFAHIPGGANGKAADSAVQTALAKLLDNEAAALLREAVSDNWKTIREDVLEQLVPHKKLKTLLLRGGCPVKPEEINLTVEHVIASARRAQMIRNRYTVLDLAWDLGVFETVLANMAAREQYW
jgi:glycerol-1-phosphate dehydrogenase [NAD(P)+]